MLDQIVAMCPSTTYKGQVKVYIPTNSPAVTVVVNVARKEDASILLSTSKSFSPLNPNIWQTFTWTGFPSPASQPISYNKYFLEVIVSGTAFSVYLDDIFVSPV
jgi:hypothetical protein